WYGAVMDGDSVSWSNGKYGNQAWSSSHLPFEPRAYFSRSPRSAVRLAGGIDARPHALLCTSKKIRARLNADRPPARPTSPEITHIMGKYAPLCKDLWVFPLTGVRGGWKNP